MYNTPVADAALRACPDCDLLQRLPDLEPGASARCPRCDLELWRRRDASRQLTLPLTLAAAVLYVVANTFPMLGLTAVEGANRAGLADHLGAWADAATNAAHAGVDRVRHAVFKLGAVAQSGDGAAGGALMGTGQKIAAVCTAGAAATATCVATGIVGPGVATPLTPSPGHHDSHPAKVKQVSTPAPAAPVVAPTAPPPSQPPAEHSSQTAKSSSTSAQRASKKASARRKAKASSQQQSQAERGEFGFEGSPAPAPSSTSTSTSSTSLSSASARSPSTSSTPSTGGGGGSGGGGSGGGGGGGSSGGGETFGFGG